ncbi:prenylated rab acceptor PRA1 [Gigaspora margarita]|uniref:PRA1 family protein n=1 Tax=Gigaspora margarita TaxID=4874 RepID=A0A8H4AQ84_GIGMA|nr:prenylated rab acceptor PRA1 [Gigaspora margarita]
MTTSTSTSQTMPGGFGGFGLNSLPISEERLTLLNRFKSERLGNIRPMSEFFDRSRISKPNGMGDVAQRLSYNLTYYQSNYIVIVIGITNLWLVLTILFLLGGLNYIRKLPPNEPLVIFERSISQKQLYIGLFSVSIPLLWISSAGSTIFWIIGASATLVIGHAALLEPGVEGGFASNV